MSSWNGFNIFERSTREPEASIRGPDTTVGPAPSTSIGHGSPVIEDPSAKLIGCPFPEYSAVGVPVPAHGQSLDREEQREDECSVTGCFDTVVYFRNSKFIHILHFLYFLVVISAVIMGLLSIHECPKSPYLPSFVAAVGIIGAAFLCIWTARGCCPRSNLRKSALSILFGLLSIATAIETWLLVHLSPNYDPLALDYCSKTFYHFLIYKEISIAVALLTAAMVYAPGSGLHTYCADCPMPLPASAFFHFR